jgi:hypothetical protein
MTASTWTGLLGAAIVAGCGSAAVMPPSAADAQARISAAEAVGAEQRPQAALHLKLARDQLAAAHQEARDGDEEDARMLVDRARLDAELALVLSRDVDARARAEQAEQRVEELKQQAK